MSTRRKQTAVVLVIIFAAAQLIRPGRANPPIDPSHTIQAQLGTASRLGPILDRACHDCHSNRTEWPWYTKIAPVSWLMAYGVKEGRKAVNYSEWIAYTPERQRALLAATCKDVTTAKMPGGIWTSLHPETRLSQRDIETICAARQTEEATR